MKPQFARIVPFFVAALGSLVVSCHANSQLELIESKEAIEIRFGGKPMLVYNVATVQPPEGADPVYARSGFIHPVYTPGGKVVTDGFPKGHMHQHGLFMAWTSTTFKGEKVDFWNEHRGLGEVFHSEVLATDSGEEEVSFKVALKHRELVSPEEEIVLHEEWEVRAYARGSDSFIFDLTSTQRLETTSPLLLNEYHYGGFGLRLSREWSDVEVADPPFQFSTSGGQNRIDGNHTRQNWVAASGLIAGETASIAVLSHPSNFRSPQPVRIHPKMPYFSYSPSVLGEFSIASGASYETRYRFVVSSSEFDEEQLNKEWDRYSQGD